MSKNSDMKEYYQSKSLTYFDFNYDQKNTKISTHIITFLEIQCRRCKTLFSSNHRLHQHFRTDIKVCVDMSSITFKNAYLKMKSIKTRVRLLLNFESTRVKILTQITILKNDNIQSSIYIY